MISEGNGTMLKILIKSRIAGIVHAFSQAASKKSKRKVSGVIVALVALLIIGLALFSVGAMFWLLCTVAQMGNTEWAVFSMATVYAALLCIIGSVFTVKTQIFESKDNDLLLSMPIPTKYIFLSRMIVLLLINYALEALVFLPCTVVYSILIGLSFKGAASLLFVFLLLPFLTLALSSIVGWIISEITSRIRHKTVVTVALFLIFFVAYMVFTMSISGDGMLFDIGIFQSTYLFWWSGDAISNGNMLSLLWFALASLIPAAVTYFVLDKSFIRIITTKKTANKIKYKGNRTRSRGAYFSLVKKELLRFFTSATYIMNAGLGSVLCVVLSIYFSTLAKNILPIVDVPDFEWVGNLIGPMVAIVCAFLGGMNFVSAPSISLEEKQLWILHSCPINPKDVLMAKLTCHLIVCAPLTLVSAVILCVAFKVSFGMSILVLLTVFVSVLFCDYLGLFLGLKFPKFGWQNEAAVVKQSLASMIAMFGSMVFFGLLGFLSFHMSKLSGYFAIIVVFAICAIICGIIHIYLISSGAKEFDNLKK